MNCLDCWGAAATSLRDQLHVLNERYHAKGCPKGWAYGLQFEHPTQYLALLNLKNSLVRALDATPTPLQTMAPPVPSIAPLDTLAIEVRAGLQQDECGSDGHTRGKGWLETPNPGFDPNAEDLAGELLKVLKDALDM